MNYWYKRNYLPLLQQELSDVTQVSSWAIVVTITTKFNTAGENGPKPLLGWGYFKPPSIQSTFTTPVSGFTPNACATAGAIDALNRSYDVCMPITFDLLTKKEDLKGVTGTNVSHAVGSGPAMWASGSNQAIAGCTSQISAITVNFDTV